MFKLIYSFSMLLWFIYFRIGLQTKQNTHVQSTSFYFASFPLLVVRSTAQIVGHLHRVCFSTVYHRLCTFATLKEFLLAEFTSKNVLINYLTLAHESAMVFVMKMKHFCVGASNCTVICRYQITIVWFCPGIPDDICQNATEWENKLNDLLQVTALPTMFI